MNPLELHKVVVCASVICHCALTQAGLPQRSSSDGSRKHAHIVPGALPEKFPDLTSQVDSGKVDKPPAPRTGPALMTPLGSRCISIARPVRYTLCLFLNVTQRDSNGDDHLLGVWDRWIDQREMLYSGGDMCPHGVARNATIRVECGMSDFALRDATEPSLCSYALTLNLPIACDALYASVDDSWTSLANAATGSDNDVDDNSCQKARTLLEEELTHLRRQLANYENGGENSRDSLDEPTTPGSSE